MSEIAKILDSFEGIGLEQMDEVALLRRVDTKFILSLPLLQEILPSLSDHYRVLKINQQALLSYHTRYLDTAELKAYFTHHNSRNPRYKIRLRSYTESQLTFLEIKEKIKGRTIKKRKTVPVNLTELRPEDKEYLYLNIMKDKAELQTTLLNSFSRCTLVNKAGTERLTIDTGLQFEGLPDDSRLEHLVIAELKQIKLDRSSFFYQTLREKGIRPMRVSKYCLGMMLTNPELKRNRFKQKLIQLSKINKHDITANIS